MDKYDNTDQVEKPVIENQTTGNRKLLFLHSLLVIAALISTVYFFPYHLFPSMEIDCDRDDIFIPKDITENELKIIKGIINRSKSGARELWQMEPDNKVYLGNYLLQILSNDDEIVNSKNVKKNDSKQIYNNYLELKEFIESLRKYDPDNGSFDLVIANFLLDFAIIKEPEFEYDKKRKELINYTPGKYDQEYLEICMEHLQNVLQKKYIRFYQADYCREYFRVYGLPENIFEKIKYKIMTSQFLLPQLGSYRNLARTSVDYGQQLLNEGKTEEAKEILKTSEILAETTVKEGWTFLEFLVVSSIAHIGERGCDALEKHGFDSEAVIMRSRVKELYKPVVDWKQLNSENNDTFDMTMYASLFDQYTIPVIYVPNKKLKPDDFKDGRDLDYIRLDFFIATTISGGLTGTMLIVIISFLFYRKKVVPVYIKPDANIILKTILLGIFLPLAIYMLLFVNGPSGARDLAINKVYPFVFTHGALAITSICFIPQLLYYSWINKILKEHGVAIPPLKNLNKLSVIIALTFFVILFVISLIPVRFISFKIYGEFLGAFFILLALLNLGILCFKGKDLYEISICSDYKIYWKSITGPALPILAVSLLTFNLLVFPYLQQKHEKIMNRICDELKPFGEIPGYSLKQEKDVIRYLKDQYRDVIPELE